MGFIQLRYLLVAFALTALAAPGMAQDERILDYHSEIHIAEDASLEVTETITVRSEQRQIRRGIYRDFPTRYRDRAGNRIVVDFEVIEVLRDGEPEPWFTENVSNGVRVNTGDDSLLPGRGEYTFTIRYRTDRQLGFFDDHDEFYWNVTGLGWAFAIESAGAEVHLPADVADNDWRLHYFTGPEGATGEDARVEVTGPRSVAFETTRELRPREGLTISVGFPKGMVEEPTMVQRMYWLLYDNRGLLVLLLGLIGMTLFYIKSWLTKGRGPAPGVIVAQYEPPEGYSPAGVRYVRRKRYDSRGFAADLVDLGVRGLLKIQTDKAGRKELWTLEKTAEATDQDLPPTQAALFPKLFEKSFRMELKPSNASRIQSAQAAHRKALVKRYHGQYINPNYPTIFTGWVISAVIAILAFRLVDGNAGLAMIVALVVLVAVNILFANLMPAPTEEGRKLLDHIEGLRRYLTVAERDELAGIEHRNEDEPDVTPERYEALLPYALALEVEEAWTGRFTKAVGAARAEETSRRMGWYSGASVGSLGAMSQSLGSNLSSSISSSASPPGSSSGSGGSSGGGGGGGGGGGR